MSEPTMAEALKVARAALAEVGANPQALVLMPHGDHDVIVWLPGMLDAETAWRANECARVVLGQAHACRTCFTLQTRALSAGLADPADGCEAAAPFTRDCGRQR